MKAFIRLVLFAIILAGVGISPARTQQQPFADPLEQRVAALERQFATLAGLPQQIAELSAKIDKLSDPLTQTPLRAPAAPNRDTLSQLAPAIRYTTVCTATGCAVVPVTDQTTVTRYAWANGAVAYYRSDDDGTALAVETRTKRRGPIRRALFGDFR